MPNRVKGNIRANDSSHIHYDGKDEENTFATQLPGATKVNSLQIERARNRTISSRNRTVDIWVMLVSSLIKKLEEIEVCDIRNRKDVSVSK